MSGRLEFVDTNIFIYAYGRSDQRKHKVAMELLERLWENQCGCISIQVMQELYVVLTRKLPSPLTYVQALSVISDLSMWRHHVPLAKDILDSSAVQERYGLSFWDAMIITSARKSGCRILWTEDLNSGQTYEGVKVVNPFYS